MATVIVDGIEVAVGDNERLNGIQAAERAGVEIPHYCWHAGPVGRRQLPHVPGRDGHEGRRDRQDHDAAQAGARLPDAGQRRHGVRHQQREGRATPGRWSKKTLLHRPPDRLPDLRQGRRVPAAGLSLRARPATNAAPTSSPFTSRRRELGDTVTLFVDRCVMCTRCVRFTREITGTQRADGHQSRQPRRDRRLPRLPARQQDVGQRRRSLPGRRAGRQGLSVPAARLVHEERTTASAPAARPAARSRSKRTRTASIACKPRENPHVNQWWMCDEGRYGYHHVHAADRLVGPRRDDATASTSIVEWNTVAGELEDEADGRGPAWPPCISPHLTVEEAYLLAKYRPRHRSRRGARARAGAGRSARTRRSRTASRFTPRSAPNRRGVEDVARALRRQGAELRRLARASSTPATIRGVWVTGGYKQPIGTTKRRREKFAGARSCSSCRTCSPRRCGSGRRINCPAASFAEREGSYVNFADRLQSFDWAIRPPAGRAGRRAAVLATARSGRACTTPRSVLDEVAARDPVLRRRRRQACRDWASI